MGTFVGLLKDIAWNVINRPNIIDLIDIALLSLIIYLLLVNVLHTRVSQTLKGIGILLVGTWLSDVLGMRTIHALLSWLVNAGPVLLLILFQSEIRRILEEMGNYGVLGDPSRDEDDFDVGVLIDEMILALQNMSRRRVGALIVIERGIRLNDVIGTGTKVDGIVTQPLIENIFEPNTPLHDGAVIVRENRVVAAGCLLRLSEATGVSRDLGTRHRAALGMSEISDAKIFVVSEETGIISLAEGGKLTRHLDENTLRQVLHGIYDETKKKDNGMNFLFRLGQRRLSGHDEQQTDKEA